MKLLKIFVLILFVNGCGPSSEQLLTDAREQMSNGNFTNALDLLDQIINNNPDNQAAFNMRGIAHLELGQTDLAIKDFDVSVKLDSSNYKSFYNRGNAYYQTEKFQYAVEDYDRALNLDPKSADIYINRGNAMVQLQNFSSAINDYKFALKLDNNNYLTHFNLARVYYLAEEMQNAQLSFQKCVQIYESYAPAYYFLGLIAMEKNEIEAACLYLKQASSLGYQQATEVLKLSCN